MFTRVTRMRENAVRLSVLSLLIMFSAVLRASAPLRENQVLLFFSRAEDAEFFIIKSNHCLCGHRVSAVVFDFLQVRPSFLPAI